MATNGILRRTLIDSSVHSCERDILRGRANHNGARRRGCGGNGVSQWDERSALIDAWAGQWGRVVGGTTERGAMSRRRWRGPQGAEGGGRGADMGKMAAGGGGGGSGRYYGGGGGSEGGRAPKRLKTESAEAPPHGPGGPGGAGGGAGAGGAVRAGEKRGRGFCVGKKRQNSSLRGGRTLRAG